MLLVLLNNVLRVFLGRRLEHVHFLPKVHVFVSWHLSIDWFVDGPIDLFQSEKLAVFIAFLEFHDIYALSILGVGRFFGVQARQVQSSSFTCDESVVCLSLDHEYWRSNILVSSLEN